MAVTNTRPGAPIVITKGRKGHQPDQYMARITGEARVAFKDNRPQLVAPVVYLGRSAAGVDFLAEDLQNLQFAFDRSERVIALDGTADHPKSWQELVADRAASALAYLKTLPESGQMVGIDDLGPELI